MYVLLIEQHDLDQTESLLTHLKEQGHHVGLAHTPEAAVLETTALWPSVIVFNSARGRLELADFQRALDETNLNIPHLIVGNKKLLDSAIGKDTIVVPEDNLKQLSQGLQEATSIQKKRFFRLPELTIDFQERRVLRNKQSHSLTPKECKLLELLILNCNQILSRKVIMQQVWETDYMGDTRTLDVHIRWLREKIEENPSRPQHLVTIRGVGYRFVVESEAE